jgi:hypothetical protein
MCPSLHAEFDTSEQPPGEDASATFEHVTGGPTACVGPQPTSKMNQAARMHAA